MDATLLREIPQPLRDVVAQIQSRSGIQITARPATPDLLKQFPILAQLPLLDIWPEEERICIWYPDETLSLPDLCHELIHARRNILESVPRMSPYSWAQDPELIYALENDLEHLFVIPEEISYFPSQGAKLEERYSIYLAQATPNAFNLFRLWVVINNALPTSRRIRDLCRTALQESNLLDDAESFREEIEAAFPDKERLLAVVLRWFPNVKRDVCTQRYVTSNRTLQVTNSAP
jgi:hypothetical protein